MAATFPDDIDPLETQEWTEALESVLDAEGPSARITCWNNWLSAPAPRRPSAV